LKLVETFITFQKIAFLPNLTDYVEVGDILLFRFDQISQKQDQGARGYSLLLILGTIGAGTGLSGEIPVRSRCTIKQWILSPLLRIRTMCVKLKFDKARGKWKLNAESVELILEVLNKDHYTSNLSCFESGKD
jgi:hypothetical protein